MRLHVVIFASMLFISLLAVPSRGDSTSDAARAAAFDQGLQAMKEADWRRAAQIFSKLWAEARTYDVALSLGQVELQLARYRDAAEHISFGLENLAPREDPRVASGARRGLATAKRYIGTLRISVDKPGAQVFVDSSLAGTSPIEDEIFVEPGHHTARAELAGHIPVEQAFEARPGQELTLELALVAAAAAPPAPIATEPTNPTSPQDTQFPEAKRDTLPIWLPWAVGAVAAAGIGTGVGFLIAANDNDDEFNTIRDRLGDGACARPTAPAADCAALQDAADAYDRNRNISTAGFVTGGAGLLALGYVLISNAMTSGDTPGTGSELRLHAQPIRGGAAAAINGSF